MRPLSAAAAAVVGTLRGGAPPLAAAAVSASKPSLPANAGPPAPGNGRQCPSAPEPLENSRREGRAGADADPSTSGRPAASWTVGGRGGTPPPVPGDCSGALPHWGGLPAGPGPRPTLLGGRFIVLRFGPTSPPAVPPSPPASPRPLGVARLGYRAAPPPPAVSPPAHAAPCRGRPASASGPPSAARQEASPAPPPPWAGRRRDRAPRPALSAPPLRLSTATWPTR